MTEQAKKPNQLMQLLKSRIALLDLRSAQKKTTTTTAKRQTGSGFLPDHNHDEMNAKLRKFRNYSFSIY